LAIVPKPRKAAPERCPYLVQTGRLLTAGPRSLGFRNTETMPSVKILAVQPYILRPRSRSA